MDFDTIIVRFGEMSTKGKNKKDFINGLARSIRHALKDFEDRKIYIQCDKKWKAKELFKALDRRGWRWASGERLKESNTHWEIYENQTYYCKAQEKDKQIRYGRADEFVDEKLLVDFSKILF